MQAESTFRRPARLVGKPKYREFLLSIIAMGASASLTAGPPMATEDTGIADPGSFEIISGAIWEDGDEGETAEGPFLDVTYGITERFQVAAAVGLAHVDNDEGSKSDWGNGAVGIKGLLWSSGGWALTSQPAWIFNISDTSARRGVSDDFNIFVLPVEFGYEAEEWRWWTELGHSWADGEGQEEWLYGAVVGRSAWKGAELLAEINGTDPERDDRSLQARIGLDQEIAENWHLLISVATGLEGPEGGELDWGAFVAIQWFPPVR